MLRTIAASTLAFVLCFSAGEASARDSLQSACPQVFADGRPPAIGRHADNRLLCFRAYAVMHSARTRTAVWSAEHLTRAAVDAARDLPRDSDFYEEPRLARNERASLNDYGRGAGFDRGHLAPSGDFGDKESQAESFSLANVMPQHPFSNRRTWSHIETSTRRLVRKVGAAYVVTGPAFIRDAGTLRGRIRIPDFVWKAIYVPGMGAAAYIARNDATPAYSAVSIGELAHFVGVDPFPSLPEAMRMNPLDLPPPTPHPGERAARKVSFAWLASAEAATAVPTAEPLQKLARTASTMVALAAAYAR